MRILLLLFPILLFAKMTNPKVAEGNCEIDLQTFRAKVLQKTQKAIIDWDEFSIEKGSSATFTLPNKNAAVLNRVTGFTPSLIDGVLKSNGQVFLINPNGVVIGKNGLVDCHSFLAAALNLTNESFLEGKLSFSGDSLAEVRNEGKILTKDAAMLIAKEINNTGSISGEKVQLLSGSEIYIEKPNDPAFIRIKGEGLIGNSGTIEGNVIEMLSKGHSIDHLAINHEGLCCSYEIEEHEGRVYLVSDGGIAKVSGEIAAKGADVRILGDYVQLLDDAKITSPEGEILVGGDYKGLNPEIPNAAACFVGENVVVNASAGTAGDGGKVIFWGNDLNYFFGTAEARGGMAEGDGGFIEVSSKGDLYFDGNVDTFSPFGKRGTVLFDPITVTIDNVANVNVVGLPPPPPMVANPHTIAYTAGAAIINNTALSNALAVNDIIIDATQAGAGTGTVRFTFGANVSWTAATTLSVLTDRNITLEGNITNTGTGNFTALSLTANGTVAGDYDGVQMFFGRTVSTTDGDIIINATGGTTNGNGGFVMDAGGVQTTMQTGSGDISITGVSRVAGVSAFSTAGGIELAGRDAILSTSGNITLNGSNTAGAGNHARGIQLDSGNNVGADRTRIVTGSGNIMATANVTPGGALSTGMRVFRGTLVQTTSGDITLSGTSPSIGLIVSNAGSEVVSASGNLNFTGIATDATTFGGYQQQNISSVRTTAGGDITIFAQSAPGGIDLNVGVGGADTIGAAGTGDITLTFDTSSVTAEPDIFEATATSTLTIQPRTLTNDIGIGGAAGTFDPDPIIARLISGFDTIVVGDPAQNSTTNIQNWPITDVSSGLPVIKNLTLRNNIINIGTGVDMNNQNLAAIIGTGGAGGTFNLNNNITNGGGTNTVTGTGGSPELNVFNAANNTVNNWNLTANDAGDYNSVGGGFSFDFTNVGTAIGGNLDDTFVVDDGIQMSGQLDGGAPPTGNTLDYSSWTTDPMVVFTGMFSGTANNLNTSGAFVDGFINFENVILSAVMNPMVILPPVVQTTLTVQNNFPAALSFDKENLYRLFEQWTSGVLDDYFLDGLIYGLVINGDVEYKPRRLFDSTQYTIEQRIKGLTKDIQAYNYLILQKDH